MFLLHKKIIPEMSGSGNKRRSVHDMCSSGLENKRRSVHDMCSSGSRKKKIIECTHERHTLLTYKSRPLRSTVLRQPTFSIVVN